MGFILLIKENIFQLACMITDHDSKVHWFESWVAKKRLFVWNANLGSTKMVKKLNTVVVAFLEAKTKQISIMKTNKQTNKNKNAL